MNSHDLTEKLGNTLLGNGARLVGVGDMTDVEGCEYTKCVSVAIPLPKHLIRDLQTAPTKEYNDIYFALNRKLNELVLLGEQTLRDAGFDAYAQTTDRVVVDGSAVESGDVARRDRGR